MNRKQGIASLFAPATYAGVLQTIDSASTLPPDVYTSDEFLQIELKEVFGSAWLFVGHVDDIAERSGFYASETPLGPLLVTRTRDGLLNAFVNSCRHRGTLLVQGAGRADSLVCPYHSWRYDLDGTLRNARGMRFDSKAREAHALVRVRIAEWAGLVFVCYDRQQCALDRWLGDLSERFAVYAGNDMACTRKVRYDVNCNWKLLLENALEAYHTGTVHRDTLGQQGSKPLVTDGQWGGLVVESDVSIAVLPGAKSGLHPFAEATLQREGGTVFTVVYPNTQLVFAHDCLWWLRIEPRGVAACTLELGSCFARAETLKTDFPALADAYYERWDRATPEDNHIAELQQLGQAAGNRSPGRFAAEEHAVHAFNQWLVRSMGLAS